MKKSSESKHLCRRCQRRCYQSSTRWGRKAPAEGHTPVKHPLPRLSTELSGIRHPDLSMDRSGEGQRGVQGGITIAYFSRFVRPGNCSRFVKPRDCFQCVAPGDCAQFVQPGSTQGAWPEQSYLSRAEVAAGDEVGEKNANHEANRTERCGVRHLPRHAMQVSAEQRNAAHQGERERERVRQGERDRERKRKRESGRELTRLASPPSISFVGHGRAPGSGQSTQAPVPPGPRNPHPPSSRG